VREKVSHPYKTTGRIMFFFKYFNLNIPRHQAGRQKRLWTEWQQALTDFNLFF
jgi:hypothetical protein